MTSPFRFLQNVRPDPPALLTRLAVVTQASPVRVRFEGDTDAAAVNRASSINSVLTVGDRVVMLKVGGRWVVIAKISGAEGELTAARLRATSSTDASLSSTGHGLQVGATGGLNVIVDNNEIMARSNGAASTLNLNADGGNVATGAGVDSTGDVSTGGGVGVSTTTLANSSTLSGGIIGANGLGVMARDTASGNSLLLLNKTGGNTGDLMQFRTNGTQRGSISSNGSTTSYNTSSDRRLKEQIRTLDSGLDRLMRLRPVAWRWRESGSAGEGFIADEVAEVVPGAVTGERDAVAGARRRPEDPEPGSIVPQQMDHSKLVPVLVAAVQELARRVQELESQALPPPAAPATPRDR